ncbi:hypothetical protein R3W88_008267 [Solanum pinnatisectum]|uniref:Retrotransposon gag domain-containing protein n=1 Tax=Solanum pinnatisectum TaxID=50273 RepID=A0AAV9M7I3_9SOLN|nr:hypothetical protein R3W88_008267 [Solanum pinnatisectum]
MMEMYEAWMNGQDPPSSIRDYLNTNMSPPIEVSTNDPIYPLGLGPYANTSNVAETSTVRPLSKPIMSNSLFVPTEPTNNIPQPTMVPKSNNDPPSKVPRNHGYTSEQALKIPSSYPHSSFKKYDGHGDPIAHLKRYCNQLRGAGSKEELLMTYFGESLMGIALEWFIDQDTSNWHTWDDLAR